MNGIKEKFESFYPGRTPERLYSAPGRTEICGNHTDHQHGRVLAAAVNVDFLACAAPNGTNTIRFQSAGWPLVEVSLDTLDPKEEEKESTAALVRGMAAQAARRGYPVAGFDAYALSDVLPGSGLSSSAACEVLLGVIAAAPGMGFAPLGLAVSPIRGAEGNVEFLLHLRAGAAEPFDAEGAVETALQAVDSV